MKWGEFIDSQNTGLLNRWRISEITNQPQFFDRFVRPSLDKGGDNRVFVLISDAFRYEAAKELADQLNGKFRIQAQLTSQLGVLPSYTALGMAALLPHRTLAYKENGEVLVDGLPTASLEQRGKILEHINGVAIKADDFMAMKKEDGRAFIKPWRVIYIHHNVVDVVGDSTSTEADTFAAVRRAIDELSNLVRHIINSLNGNRIVITADHGFLYQETPPTLTDKSVLTAKPEGTVKAKKRYLLGHALPDNDKVWHGRTEVTAGVEGGMEFWVPKGANRFHFTGGARFIHGGAMPQEIVVPVIPARAKGLDWLDVLNRQGEQAIRELICGVRL